MQSKKIEFEPEVEFIFKPCRDRLKAERIIKIFYTALKKHYMEMQNKKITEQYTARKELIFFGLSKEK
jgi:hypothetical protein